jgi:sigma-B regulation protein RsbU (phosphoserine phosphatase)
MKPEDICVFYTDGITEARNASSEEFGYERLLNAVLTLRKSGAEEIKEGILQAVRTFLGNSAYTDDMTLVVIKWRTA